MKIHRAISENSQFCRYLHVQLFTPPTTPNPSACRKCSRSLRSLEQLSFKKYFLLEIPKASDKLLFRARTRTMP